MRSRCQRGFHRWRRRKRGFYRRRLANRRLFGRGRFPAPLFDDDGVDHFHFVDRRRGWSGRDFARGGHFRRRRFRFAFAQKTYQSRVQVGLDQTVTTQPIQLPDGRLDVCVPLSGARFCDAAAGKPAKERGTQQPQWVPNDGNEGQQQEKTT